MPSDTLLFHVPFTAGRVDHANCVIHGVSLITGDIEAEGHNLHVDDTTLGQIHSYAAKRKKITVKADHKGPDGQTFKAIVGYLTNFLPAPAGGKVRGDLELLKTDSLTPKILEMAERMPENFGLSVAFKGKGVKGKGGKQFARCERLLSVDLVETPAANPDGLFSVPVDSADSRMPKKPTELDPPAEPTLADVMAAIAQQGEQLTALTGRIEAQEQTNQQLTQLLNQPDLADLANMTDEQLAEAGFDVEAVRAAVDSAIQSGELTSDGDGTGDGSQGTGDGEGAAQAGTVGAALHALQREIVALKRARAQDIQLSEQEQVDHAFSVIETKVEALAAQNGELATSLATKEAEIKSLRSTLKTGTGRGVAPGVEGATTLFNAKAPEGSYEQIVGAEFARLMKTPGMTELKAKSQAIDFGVKKHPGAYQEWRSRGSGTIEFAAA